MCSLSTNKPVRCSCCSDVIVEMRWTGRSIFHFYDKILGEEGIKERHFMKRWSPDYILGLLWCVSYYLIEFLSTSLTPSFSHFNRHQFLQHLWDLDLDPWPIILPPSNLLLKSIWLKLKPKMWINNGKESHKT